MSEKHFDINVGTDPRVGDTNKHVPIMTVNKYKYMDDAYYSTGGFKDGTYLIPHAREMFYTNRRELSAYRNFLRPIIRSLIEPVFEEDIPRTIDGTPVDDTTTHPYATFLENVDNDETNMDEFSEGTALQARLHGIAFVVMDNYSEQPMTMAEATEKRIMPYIYRRSAEDVETWSCNPYGALTSITFCEHSENKDEKAYRMWTDTYSVMMTKDKSDKLVETQPKVYHNLGVIPVIVVLAQQPRCKHDILVDPPMYDIARLCHVLYNKDSEIRDQERAQAFSNFYMQGDPNGSVTIGPHNVIFVPMEATISPGFASPDSSILAGLVTNAEKLQQSIYAQAEQQGVIGVKSAESGVAAEWHFWSVESQLQHTSKMAERFEEACAKLFMKWTNMEFDFGAEYPGDFQPGDQKAIIDRYKVIMDMSPTPALSKAIWTKIARMTLADEDPEVLQAVEDEINGEDQPETPESGDLVENPGEPDPEQMAAMIKMESEADRAGTSVAAVADKMVHVTKVRQ